MSTQSKLKSEDQNVVLEPSYRLPVFIILFGLTFLLSPLHPWPTIAISVFGLFLLLQSFTLRLKFTQNDLVVMQLGRELRRFPFKNWISWRIFLPQLPGLLYFREQASPHLLPIIFNIKSLESQLKSKVGSLEIKPNKNSSK